MQLYIYFYYGHFLLLEGRSYVDEYLLKKSIRGREINRMRWEKKTGRHERKKIVRQGRKKGNKKKNVPFYRIVR